MPDLFTHFTSGVILRKFTHREKLGSVIILGCSLPDLVTRLPSIALFYLFNIEISYFVIPLHTPIGILITCYFVSMFFEFYLRKKVFYYLLFGSFIHLTLDLMQIQFLRSDYFLFFPFSFYTIDFGLFHYDSSVSLFIPECILLCLFVLYGWLSKKNELA